MVLSFPPRFYLLGLFLSTVSKAGRRGTFIKAHLDGEDIITAQLHSETFPSNRGPQVPLLELQEYLVKDIIESIFDTFQMTLVRIKTGEERCFSLNGTSSLTPHDRALIEQIRQIWLRTLSCHVTIQKVSWGDTESALTGHVERIVAVHYA